MLNYYYLTTRQLLSSFSFERFVNGLVLLSSYFFSRITGKVIHKGYPLNISFEPTNICNLGCTECPAGMHTLTRKQGKLNFELFKKLVDNVYKKTPAMLLYFQGEPYLNPSFFDLVFYARNKKMYVSTSTNAHYLNKTNCRKTIESGLSKLIVSVDGTTQEVYEQYRKGGNLEIVLDGISRLVEMKKTMRSKSPVIEMQFIVFRHNEHQLNNVKKLAKKLGVNRLILKTAQVYDFEKEKDIIPENKKYSRYTKQANGSYQLKFKQYNHCWKSWQSPVITWDGFVVPCCYDKDAVYQAGNIRNKKFIQIWKNSTIRNFQQQVLKNRQKISICNNCIEGTKFFL